MLDTIDQALAAGHTMYVHCWGGVGRTGTVVGCHLVRHGQQGTAALHALARRWQTVAKRPRHPCSPETEAQPTCNSPGRSSAGPGARTGRRGVRRSGLRRLNTLAAKTPRGLSERCSRCSPRTGQPCQSTARPTSAPMTRILRRQPRSGRLSGHSPGYRRSTSNRPGEIKTRCSGTGSAPAGAAFPPQPLAEIKRCPGATPRQKLAAAAIPSPLNFPTVSQNKTGSLSF